MLKEFGPYTIEDRNMIQNAFQEDSSGIVCTRHYKRGFTFKGRNSPPALTYVY